MTIHTAPIGSAQSTKRNNQSARQNASCSQVRLATSKIIQYYNSCSRFVLCTNQQHHLTAPICQTTECTNCSLDPRDRINQHNSLTIWHSRRSTHIQTVGLLWYDLGICEVNDYNRFWKFFAVYDGYPSNDHLGLPKVTTSMF